MNAIITLYFSLPPRGPYEIGSASKKSIMTIAIGYLLSFG